MKKLEKMKQRKWTKPALAAATIATTGCSDDDVNPVILPSGGGDIGTGAMVRVAHASPDAPAVDVYANDGPAPVVVNSWFTETTPCLGPSCRGHHDRAVGRLVFQRPLPGGAGAPGFTALPLAAMFEDTASPLARIVHVSSDAPSVDVGLWDGKSFTPVSDYSDLAFGDAPSDMSQASEAMPKHQFDRSGGLAFRGSAASNTDEVNCNNIRHWRFGRTER